MTLSMTLYDGPESIHFTDDPTVSYAVTEPKYILRPETVESLLVLHRVTGMREGT